jgi:hypothetical protein
MSPGSSKGNKLVPQLPASCGARLAQCAAISPSPRACSTQGVETERGSSASRRPFPQKCPSLHRGALPGALPRARRFDPGKAGNESLTRRETPLVQPDENDWKGRLIRDVWSPGGRGKGRGSRVEGGEAEVGQSCTTVYIYVCALNAHTAADR